MPTALPAPLPVPPAHSQDRSRKAVNLTLDRELLRQGKELGLNLSSIAEQALARAVQERLDQLWLAENAGAIQAYNRRVAERGVFSDGLRTF